MTPESILANKQLILSQQARLDYFQQGYAIAHDFLNKNWLDRMREAYLAAIERSRELRESNQWS